MYRQSSRSPYQDSSNNQHYSQADYESTDQRGRSRSPERRNRSETPPAQLPTGPRALQGKQQMQPRFHSDGVQSRADLPALIEYQFILPTSNLVRFLIGPRGDRSRRIKQYSNVMRVTFSDSDPTTRNDMTGTKGTGVCWLKGNLDSIKRALECIAIIVDEEIQMEESTGNKGIVAWGDWRAWTTFDESFIGVYPQPTHIAGANKPQMMNGGGHGGGYEVSYRSGPESRREEMSNVPTGPSAGTYGVPYASQTWEEKDRREKEKGPSGLPDVVIPIPQIALSSIIGTKGSMIRQINTATGAYLRVDRSGPGLPLLNIFGEPQLIPKVMELVDEIVLRMDPTWTGGMNQPNQVAQGQYPRAHSAEGSYSRQSEARPTSGSYRDDRRDERDDRHRSDDRASRHEDRSRRGDSRERQSDRSRREEPERREYHDDREERRSARETMTEQDLMDLLDSLPRHIVDNVAARRQRRTRYE